jgi:hypothetical protein
VFGAIALLISNPRLIIELRDKTKVRAGANYLTGLGLAR